MKITPGTNRNVHTTTKKVTASAKNENFSDFLQSQHQRQYEVEVAKMIEDIKKAGDKLKNSLSVVDAWEYKKLIKEYLHYIINNHYVVNYTHSLRAGLLSKVHIIDQKIQEMTEELMNTQKKNIKIASKIEEIIGLLIDLYT
ncbi:hypothetical protein SAMN05660649_00571 [Desulfotomaculum arcticum]|uniref:DUF327 domain-containing protein n=1 Tax=Desulfotruncus arcticus DSM 17038 TaxID=1121424 RepID=A0A1I2NU79_9FIRM|nr:YaaR family protein [Desulfotruncus arcticus]SFG07318.1 hypothetical protein SAMN05660649_00571 [Desulfotomaculum arcticum] [Desulfotruncus arcticus DSM 17038]